MASYEQNKSSKLWSVRFRCIEDGKEKNKRLSGFRTKREAQTGYLEYLNEQKKKAEEIRILATEPNDMLFDRLLDLYLENLQNRVKETSFYDNEQKVNKRIRPFFSGMTIKEIEPATILKWQNSLSEYSYNYKSGLRTLLSSILRFGERYYDTKNIMYKVEPFRNQDAKKEMQIWTPEIFTQFIKSVKDPDYNAFFWTLYITGGRKGEILALNWSDIDLNNKIIKIRKNIAKQPKSQSSKITTPKNQSSNRDTQIPDFLIKILSEYKVWQAENFEDCSFAFGGAKPIAFTSLDRYFKKACINAGVPIIRIHDLRHSNASLLISSGVSIVAVSKRLGHSTVEQTLNTYSHMMPDDQTMIMRILEKTGTKSGTKN